ncbi:kinase-like domain-containing protein [Tanacetum coccineum]
MLLVNISLAGNHLVGSLPSEIGRLEMGNNDFSGKLTIDFSKLRDIYKISLHNNNLHGRGEADDMRFIDSLINCTKLVYLEFYKCNLIGVLPISIGNLSEQLTALGLGDNQLFGSLPSSIGNLVDLAALQLGPNRFKGEIPTTIGKLQKLQVLGLNNNEFSGPIPDVIGNLSLLNKLYLYSNKLEGPIPSSLAKCKELNGLNLAYNRLSGNIPKQLLQLPSLTNFVVFSYNNLSGSIPLEIKDLKMLSGLDLSYNKLSGNITSSLGECISLTELYLSGNIFQGTIPPSLSSLGGLHGEVPVVGVFANTSAFSVSGNNRLCGGLVKLKLPKCKERGRHKIRFPFFILVIVSAPTLLVVLGCVYLLCKKKHNSQPSQSSRHLSAAGFLKVSYSELLKATDGFSAKNLIGEGGFSSVYKGNLDSDDGKFVAVKVLHLQNQGAHKSFVAECEAWRNIRHRNLLKIITSCSSVDLQGNNFKALVYEFMPNGSLHDWLHSTANTSKLNLVQRINILIDVATALDYLHNQCHTTIVHGDLKPSNILLDDDLVAHVGDFGLARLLGTDLNTDSSTGVKGTIGYAPPEYGIGSEMTICGDVYSFGILLLEVMTGKKPTDDMFNDGLSLHKFAYMALLDHVIDVIDGDAIVMQITEANAKKVEECLAATMKIGVSCSLDSPPQRLKIEIVVNELQHIVDVLQNILGLSSSVYGSNFAMSKSLSEQRQYLSIFSVRDELLQVDVVTLNGWDQQRLKSGAARGSTDNFAEVVHYRMINHLRGHGVKMALASNSSRDSIETKISYHRGWKESFSVIIDGDEVRKCKIRHDIFLEAAKRRSVDPSKCLVSRHRRFTGDSYEFWSIKMKTLFKSQDLWDFVESGYEEASNDEAPTSAKQAWSLLKTEYQGSAKVITVKLQSVRHDFETSYMKNNESAQEYLAKISSIVSRMRSYGDSISDEVIVAKVLRSLAPKFDHVVAAIEELKVLSTFSFDELMGSLQAHEVRINRSFAKEEKVFQTKGESDSSSQRGRGRGRGGFRGRGRGRGQSSSLYCTFCNKNGHTEKFCWSKPEEAKYAEENEEQEDFLFMAKTDTEMARSDIWYIDSGCSHHITGDKSKFKDLDESVRSHVRLGDDKQLQSTSGCGRKLYT